ncbi:MAG: nucleotidyl transferase AbiEii/AbiGii toxin family protein [Porticoccaceae bacterium]
MFKFTHHEHVLSILNALDDGKLNALHTYFGGGTAISLMLGEYRLSTDIDFLCSNQSAYRELKDVFRDPFERRAFLGPDIQEHREFRVDGYGIRGVVSIGQSLPIRFEIVSEARISLDPGLASLQGSNVPVLSRSDLFAQKLLANDDRGLDDAYHNRDVIDLAFMAIHWGSIPERALRKVNGAYPMNKRFLQRLERTKRQLHDAKWMAHCLESLSIDQAWAPKILTALERLPGEHSAVPPCSDPAPGIPEPPVATDDPTPKG